MLQNFKLWGAALLIGAIMSAIVTSSVQVIEEQVDSTQSWQSSSPYSKDEKFFAEMKALVAKYSEHPLLSKYFSGKDDEDEDAEIVKLAGLSGVTLPGGEQLLGIISKNDLIYVLLSDAEESENNEDGLIEANIGYELPSGYTLVGINASSILLQSASDEVITVELYQ